MGWFGKGADIKLPFRNVLYMEKGMMAVRAISEPWPGKTLETVHQRPHDGP